MRRINSREASHAKNHTRRVGALIGWAVGLSAQPVLGETQTFNESVYDESYRCVSDTLGGYSHRKRRSDLVQFTGQEEFFLTHISEVPVSALRGYIAANVEGAREAVETMSERQVREAWNSFFVVSDRTNGLTVQGIGERNTYFIRTPDLNPKESSWLSYGACRVAASNLFGREIHCHASMRSGTMFIFDMDTGRFSYASLGSRHSPQKDGHYGDSSVFAFGECAPYYP